MHEGNICKMKAKKIQKPAASFHQPLNRSSKSLKSGILCSPPTNKRNNNSWEKFTNQKLKTGDDYEH